MLGVNGSPVWYWYTGEIAQPPRTAEATLVGEEGPPSAKRRLHNAGQHIAETHVVVGRSIVRSAVVVVLEGIARAAAVAQVQRRVLEIKRVSVRERVKEGVPLS